MILIKSGVPVEVFCTFNVAAAADVKNEEEQLIIHNNQKMYVYLFMTYIAQGCKK